MPVPVVAIGLYVPVVPILRSMMNLALPPELSTQLRVSRASLLVPVAPREMASSTAPIVIQVVCLTTVRSIGPRDALLPVTEVERLRHRSNRNRGRAVRESGGEGKGAAGKELVILVVGGEEDEAAAVGDREAHGHGVGSIQHGPVERGGDGQDPELGGAARVPCAGAIAVETKRRDEAAAGGAHGRREGAIEGAIRCQGGIALPDAILKLAVIGQRQKGRGRHRGHRGCGRAVREGGGEGEGAAGKKLEILVV